MLFSSDKDWMQVKMWTPKDTIPPWKANYGLSVVIMSILVMLDFILKY